MKLSFFRLPVLFFFVSSVALAAAGQGLKWSASTTYDDGTAIEADKKVVYLVFNNADGKQVLSTLDLSAAASRLPTDGCYYVHAAILNAAGTGIVAGSSSAPTEAKCTKTVTIQKKVAKPLNFDVQ